MNKQMGVVVDGVFFKEDGSDMGWAEFIEKIESVGLQYGGETAPMDDEGNEYEVLGYAADWIVGKKIGNYFDK